MARIRRRPLRDVAGALGTAIKVGCSLHTAVNSPGKALLVYLGGRLERFGRYRKRVGPVRNRAQAFNPRTRTWVKFKIRKGRWRIMGNKKTPGPYKGIRKVRGRRRRRRK